MSPMSASMSLCCSASSCESFCESPCESVGATLHPASPAVSTSDPGAYSRVLAPPEPFASQSTERVRDHATRLLTAACNGHTADVTDLFAELNDGKKRALLNAVDAKTGNTPLALAAMHGQLDMCKLLLFHKADVHAVNKVTRETAFDLAKQHQHKEVMKELIDAGVEDYDDI